MTLEARLLDAGTRPLVELAAEPGKDRVTWVEIDMEDEQVAPRLFEVNRLIQRDTGTMDVTPWPAKVPRKMPLDYTAIHGGPEGQGVRLEVLNGGWPSGVWSPVPYGVAQFVDGPLDPFNQEHMRMSAAPTLAEIRLDVEDPTEWTRLPYVNEVAGTRLGQASVARWQALTGPSFTFRMPDNDLVTPFDLTQLDRYDVVDDDGKPRDELRDFTTWGRSALLRLYLRPRRWRWVARVIAHYLNISPFEVIPEDVFIIRTFHTRPPVHPLRHNIRETTQVQDVDNFFGEPRSVDAGIADGFDRTRAAQIIRQEIIGAQFLTPCLAFVFIGNENADLTISRVAPRGGDIVLGVGRVDRVTDLEQRVWFRARADQSDIYPPQVVGQFLVPYTVVG